MWRRLLRDAVGSLRLLRTAVRREREKVVFVHLCIAAILKLDGVNDSAGELLEVSSVPLIQFGNADDFRPIARPRVGRCVF
jgi:hypothetical protein